MLYNNAPPGTPDGVTLRACVYPVPVGVSHKLATIFTSVSLSYGRITYEFIVVEPTPISTRPRE